jgi:hypothetical protein
MREEATIVTMFGRATSQSPYPPGPLVRCGTCGEATDSIKQYRMFDYLLFLGIFAVWRTVVRTGCPRCIRRDVLGRTLINIVLANLLWFPVVLPWHVIQALRSLRRGHSKNVLVMAPDDVPYRDVMLFKIVKSGTLCGACGHKNSATRGACETCGVSLAPQPRSAQAV